jgi:uncharacterized protein
MNNAAAPPRLAYAAFDGPDGLRLAGKLALPPGEGCGPAVLICHGSDGVDGRGDFHAEALNSNGIATFEIDMWAARGVSRGASARPRLPTETVPDAFAALRFMAQQPEIDVDRIGILGFSWGGVVSLLTSALRHRGQEPLTFAAHAALYPVCWAYHAVPALHLGERSPAPVLILTGAKDAYDSPGAGQRVAALMRESEGGRVACHEYLLAGHGFDRARPAQVVRDPFAGEGKGADVRMAFHGPSAWAARRRVVRFFQHALEKEGDLAGQSLRGLGRP